MFDAVAQPELVPFDGSFRVADTPTDPGDRDPGKKACRKRLAERIEELRDLQRMLFAHDHHAILLVFQAMDAAGKDGTIRAVMSGVNPAGCQVFNFKQPTQEDLDHDFLWRVSRCLPERGRIGIFNRSHYEEVLVVRVHPEYLQNQRLPSVPAKLGPFWKARYQSILDYEAHLARSGTVVLKFWLNVSRDEQRKRFYDRIDQPDKNWKFSTADIRERQHWDTYMEAYQDALNATSRPWAPWYAIPADDKPYMRMRVADILVESLQRLDLHYPELDAAERSRLGEMRQLLEDED